MFQELQRNHWNNTRDFLLGKVFLMRNIEFSFHLTFACMEIWKNVQNAQKLSPPPHLFGYSPQHSSTCPPPPPGVLIRAKQLALWSKPEYWEFWNSHKFSFAFKLEANALSHSQIFRLQDPFLFTKTSLVPVKSSLSQNNQCKLGFFNTEIPTPELPVFTSTYITTHSIGRLVG